MAKTNWQDPQTSKILSAHIAGLQESAEKIEEILNLDSVTEINIPLSELFIKPDDRYRIFQAPKGKRNWLLAPIPVIKKNGIIISVGFSIEYGGGAIILTTNALNTDVFTADVAHTINNGKNLSELITKVDNLYTASLVDSYIYGVQWDKTSNSILTRTDHGANAIVNNGVDSEIVENSMDLSGLFKDFREVADDYGNVFIRIPKIYLKKTDVTEYFSWKASRKKFDGSYLPWCFWDFDNNRELDYVDIGKYKASLSNDGTKLESKSGKYPLINKNIVQFRDYAKANGSEYQQLDIHAMDLLQTLFIIEQATIHSQSKMAGYTSGQYTATHLAIITESGANRIIVPNATAALYEVGQAISIGTSQGGNQIFYGRDITAIEVYDANNKAIIFDGTPVNITIGNMLYNTGYKNGFSNNIASSVGSIKSNSSGKHPFVWHGIESLYGDIYQFIDGINIIQNQSWVCKNAKNYASNIFTSPYEKLSYINSNANGYISALGFDVNNPFVQFPVSATGGNTTYFGDYYYQSTGQYIALVGGFWSYGSVAGLFFWHLSYSSSSTSVYIGGRLLRKAL